MAPISTRQYLLDRARRRFTPTLSNIPGMGVLEKLELSHEWKQKVLAEPPPGSGLKPVVGNSGLPLLGHTPGVFRGGPDFARHLYRTYGPVFFSAVPILGSVNVLGPDATQAVLVNKNKDFSQQGWQQLIGPFFNRGLMLLDFDEHMFHRRIMQEAFVRSRLIGYVEQMDKVVSQVIANDWVANDARFLLYPAMKELTLDIASMVFMGH